MINFSAKKFRTYFRTRWKMRFSLILVRNSWRIFNCSMESHRISWLKCCRSAGRNFSYRMISWEKFDLKTHRRGDDNISFCQFQIIKAGTTGDQIYFLTSGTGERWTWNCGCWLLIKILNLHLVCVTTANGKELYHFHEGEYFGEIGLALKNNKVNLRTAQLKWWKFLSIISFLSFHYSESSP